MHLEGGCHCGAVRFRVDVPEGPLLVHDCNCSICRKSGFLHLIVPKSKFELLSGKEQIVTYAFNTGVARHHFCRICGIKSFYVPRSNPDGFDINARCLDKPVPELRIEPFDGQNWEKSAADLAHFSREG